MMARQGPSSGKCVLFQGEQLCPIVSFASHIIGDQSFEKNICSQTSRFFSLRGQSCLEVQTRSSKSCSFTNMVEKHEGILIYTP